MDNPSPRSFHLKTEKLCLNKRSHLCLPCVANSTIEIFQMPFTLILFIRRFSSTAYFCSRKFFSGNGDTRVVHRLLNELPIYMSVLQDVSGSMNVPDTDELNTVHRKSRSIDTQRFSTFLFQTTASDRNTPMTASNATEQSNSSLCTKRKRT